MTTPAERHMPDSWLASLPPLIGPNGTAWNPAVLRMGGWSKLIRELVDDLIALGWDCHLMQIKEKYGGLRFYVGGVTEDVWDRIDRAEAESFEVCEACGEPGRCRDNKGWYMRRCDACWSEEIG